MIWKGFTTDAGGANRNKIGIQLNNLPDTEWLNQITRYIEPDNTSAIFQKVVKDPHDSTVNSGRVSIAQIAAEYNLLKDHGLINKRDIMESIQDL